MTSVYLVASILSIMTKRIIFVTFSKSKCTKNLGHSEKLIITKLLMNFKKKLWVLRVSKSLSTGQMGLDLRSSVLVVKGIEHFALK